MKDKACVLKMSSAMLALMLTGFFTLPTIIFKVFQGVQPYSLGLVAAPVPLYTLAFLTHLYEQNSGR